MQVNFLGDVMKTRKYLFIPFLILASSHLFAQRNYGQELVNLLNEGKCFEARDFKKQYKDSMPKSPVEAGFVELYYKYKMASFLNKPDSTDIYLHQLVTDYEDILGTSKPHFYGEMLNHYLAQQQFDKGVALCDEIIAYMERNPFKDKDKTHLENEIKETERIKKIFVEKDKNEPRIKIVRNNADKNKLIRLYNDSTFFSFDAEYNGQVLKTLFDTGVSYHFFMNKKVADKIGVIFKPTKDSVQVMNGKNVRAIEGVIDSVELGNVKLYSIPVMVLLDGFTPMDIDLLDNTPEKRAKVEDAFNKMQIILGLPTMRLIGQFEFDWKNKSLIFPQRHSLKKETPNVYNNGLWLNTQLNISNLNYSGIVDTGALCFIDIDSAFYEKHKGLIQIDTLAQKRPLNYAMITGVYCNIPYELLAQKEKIYFNNKILHRSPNDVQIHKANYSKAPTGMVGIYFFRRLGSKVLFDFQNMRIEGNGKLVK
jgi:hypothetical protein